MLPDHSPPHAEGEEEHNGTRRGQQGAVRAVRHPEDRPGVPEERLGDLAAGPHIPQPHVVIQYFDGRTGDLVYAEPVHHVGRN